MEYCRMPCGEVGEPRNELSDADARRHPDPQMTAHFIPFMDALLGIIQLTKNSFDLQEKFAAHFGRHGGLRGSLVQAHAKIGFQAGNDARNLRLRQTASPCGRQETAEPRDTCIEPKRLKILRGSRDNLPKLWAIGVRGTAQPKDRAASSQRRVSKKSNCVQRPHPYTTRIDPSGKQTLPRSSRVQHVPTHRRHPDTANRARQFSQTGDLR